jgi:S-adenosylmethionine decarboxylase
MFNGSAYVHGPVNADHWFTYVADCSKTSPGLSTDRTLNIMMFDLDEEVANKFVKGDEVKSADDCARLTGLKDTFPKGHFQHHLFDPCGYSSNIIDGDTYYTAHVTPEKGFSYASFETNARFPEYHAYIDKILKVFRPGRFTVTLVADQSGNAEVQSHPSDRMKIQLPGNVHYERRISTQAHFERGYCSHMTNYERVFPPTVP